MTDIVQFHPLFPWPVILVVTVLVAVLLVVLELKRKSRHLLINLMLQLLAVLSLLGLASRPYTVKDIYKESVIILTGNYDVKVADSLHAVLGNPPLFHQAGTSSSGNSLLLHSFDELQGKHVYVIGDGIFPYNLARVKAADFHFFPSPVTPGVKSLMVESPAILNRRSTVKGVINFEKPGAILLLKGPEGNLDSIRYSTYGDATFELNFRPRVSGEFVYQLILQDSLGDIVFSEPVPVSVLKERKLNILILQAFPSAEMRFLKNYLGERGHQIAIRYGISKNIDRSEFVNRKPEALGRISKPLLERFDLVLISTSAYAELGIPAQHILDQSVQEGLGLIFMLEDELSNNVRTMLPLEIRKTTRDTANIKIGEGGFYTFPRAPIQISRNEALNPILSNANTVVTGFVSRGMGKVGFQLLQEVYPLRLSGKDNEYALLWSPLLEQVARNEPRVNQIEIRTPFPWYPDEPITIQLLSSLPAPVLKFNDIPVPLIEDARIDGIWTTKVWSFNTGWQQLSVEGDSLTVSLYISNENDWVSLRKAEQKNQNRMFPINRPDTDLGNKKREDEFSPLLFFIVFLFASGGLWLLPKL